MNTPFGHRPTTSRPASTRRPWLISSGFLLLALTACKSGGGGSAAQISPPTPVDSEILGIFLEAKTLDRDDLRRDIIIQYLLGPDGQDSPIRWRATLGRIVESTQICDSHRVTASIMSMMEAHRAGENPDPGLDADTMGRLVAAIVTDGGADPDRPTYRTLIHDLVEEVAPGLAAAGPGGAPARPDGGLSAEVLLENITPAEYASVGKALRSVFQPGTSLGRARELIMAQVNDVLGPLEKQFELASGNPAAIEGFRKVESVLHTVGRVSEFVFGKLFTGETADKIGRTIQRVVQVGTTLAKIGGAIFSGGVSGILSGDLIGSVMGLFGLSENDVVAQKLDQLQESVQRLTSLVELTRVEMHLRFDRLEGRIVQLQRRLDQMFRVMVDGLNQLSNQLKIGFEGIGTLLQNIHSNLVKVQADIEEIYLTIRWYANAEATRDMQAELSRYFQQLSTAQLDLLAPAQASLAQALEVLKLAPTGANFVRSAPVQSLRDAVAWLPAGRDKQAMVRIAGMGVLPQIMPYLGVQPLRPYNFEVFHTMARACLDTVAARPELLDSRVAVNGLAADLSTQIVFGRGMIVGLGSMIVGSADVLVNRAEAAEVEWLSFIDGFADFRRMHFAGGPKGDPGRLLLAYLDTPYFDAARTRARLPFRDSDGGFVTETEWPPGFGKIPAGEFVYEFLDRKDVVHYRRSVEGFDYLRLGIMLGVIRVQEASRSGTSESLDLFWNTEASVVKDSGLRGIHNTKLAHLELREAASGLPALIVISTGGGGWNKRGAGFTGVYFDVQDWVRIYLGDLRDAIGEDLGQRAALALPQLKDFYAAAACTRYSVELAMEAAYADPQFLQSIRTVLDRPAMFHESLLSSTFARGIGQTTTDWEAGIVVGLRGFIATLRDPNNDLSEPLASVRFYDDLLRGALEPNARALQQDLLTDVVPRLQGKSFRFAAVDEIEAGIRRLRASRK